MANVAMGFSSSPVFGIPIGRIVASAHDWKTLFWGIGKLCLLALFAVTRAIPAYEGEPAVPLSQRFSFLRQPRIAITLSVTFFVFIGLLVVDTYIAPYLTAVMPTMETSISFVLLLLGIGSLIGSRLGGFLADRIGTIRTLLIPMATQTIDLVVVPAVSNWIAPIIALLMLWEIACWTFGPTQNFNLVSLTPQSSGIVLCLNSTSCNSGLLPAQALEDSLLETFQLRR